jgi:hypothetical protein
MRSISPIVTPYVSATCAAVIPYLSHARTRATSAAGMTGFWGVLARLDASDLSRGTAAAATAARAVCVLLPRQVQSLKWMTRRAAIWGQRAHGPSGARSCPARDHRRGHHHTAGIGYPRCCALIRLHQYVQKNEKLLVHICVVVIPQNLGLLD